jgi:uncharacterized membrane protein YhaH (DUF805 family)
VSNLENLYLGFDGRLRRRDFWRAGAALILAEIALTIVLARMAGLGLMDFAYGSRKAGMIHLVIVSFFFWPSLAITVKRLHDRDLPGWWAGLMHMLMFLTYAQMAFFRSPVRGDKLGLLMAVWPALLLVPLGAWLMIELVLLRGTPGPNRFGPDPVEADPPMADAAPRNGAGLSSERQGQLSPGE